MTQKLGRYAPCPCGSGKRFKDCCRSATIHFRPSNDYDWRKDPRFAAIADVMVASGTRAGFKPQPSFRDPNNTYRFVGNRMYRRPPKETFHEFLIYLLQSTLEPEWHDKQRRLPYEERHQIFKWFRAATEFSRSLIQNPEVTDGEHFGAAPTGDVQALATLAYDIFLLLHLGPIPQDLVDRLKDKREFQGARYEILVAAALLHAGCIPEFVHEKSIKHWDINAIDVVTGISIGVEAKSRHRSGTLGFQGEPDAMKAMRGDVEALINEALQQQPEDRPFVIFVDLNSPHTPETPIEFRQWYDDIWKLMQSAGEPSADKPDDFNILVFTNFSYHWQRAEKATGGDHLFIHSGYPRHSLPPDISARIVDSVQTYGSIPKEI